MLVEVDDRIINNLTVAEQSILNFINRNGRVASMMTINELADASYTSISTVSRSIRKFGFSGMPELRAHLISKMSGSNESDIVNETLLKCYRECVHTIDDIRIKDILEVVNYIRSAKKIFVLAYGVTTFSAEEFTWRLQVERHNVFLLTDSQLMSQMETLAVDEDLIIIITEFDSSPVFEIAAKTCHELGCKVVTICCTQDSNLPLYSDVVLNGHIDKSEYMTSYGGASRLPLHLICRVIIDYMSK